MTDTPGPGTAEIAIPLHVEELTVSRRKVAGDKVRVTTAVHERERQIDEELTHERIEIEHVPVGRRVDAVPPVREEGDTTIMSVVEEVVVVERRLMLKEEVHIRRVRVTERHRETVTVREQEAVITRIEAGQPTEAADLRHLGTAPTPLAQEQ